MTNDPCPSLRFHLVGEWDEARRADRLGRQSHVLPPEAGELIEEAWQTASARPGVKLFDGPMCRLESWSERPGARRAPPAPCNWSSAARPTRRSWGPTCRTRNWPTATAGRCWPTPSASAPRWRRPTGS